MALNSVRLQKYVLEFNGKKKIYVQIRCKYAECYGFDPKRFEFALNYLKCHSSRKNQSESKSLFSILFRTVSYLITE